MPAVDPLSDPLRAFLWGKRGARRHPVALRVELKGTQGPVPGFSVDVSTSGALLLVREMDLRPEGHEEADAFALVQTHFRGAFAVRFPTLGVKAHAELVRIAMKPEREGLLFLGCCFSRPLGRGQLRRFGLEEEDCAPETDMHGLPSQMLPLHPGDEQTLKAEIFERPGSRRPLLAGKLLGVGDHSVCIGVTSKNPAMIAARLHRDLIQLRVSDGGDVLWSAGASLRAIGFPEDQQDYVEVGFVTETPADPRLEALLEGR